MTDPRAQASPESYRQGLSLEAANKFAEPGVPFVHRPDQPSACAYRLLGSASTYLGPVLGAPGDYDGPAVTRKGRRPETCRKLRRA